MSVRAKFWVHNIRPFGQPEPGADPEGYEIELQPVYDGSEENKDFYKWTPHGNIVLATINTEAAKQFGAGGDYYGKEFYVDFTPADK